MERTIILIFIVIVLVAGGGAAWGAIAQANHNKPVQEDYTVLDGPCEIRVYNDPLYAEHWAKNVNKPNCESYQTQEQARYTEKQAERIEWNTTQAKFGVYTVLGVFLALFVLLGVAVLRG